MVKIAIVVSHPIQHFCPQYSSWAKKESVNIKVFFGSAMGFKSYIDPSFGKEIVWDNLNLESFSHLFLNGDKVYPANKDLDAPNLNEELFSFAPDIIISYGYFQKLQKRAHNWAIKNNVPVGFISDSENRRKRPFIIKMLKAVYVRMRFSNIKYFLSVGDANEDYYKNYGVSPRKMIRIPFPIDTLSFEAVYRNKLQYRLKIRQQYQISEDAIVLGVVGKIESFKRQQDIIKAINEISESIKTIVLLIIGTGPNEFALKSLIREHNNHKVIFTGFVNPTILPEFYSALDIYIHPSEKDAHSLAISEAIFMGCPILVSDKCGSYGTTDDVQEGKNGFVFELGNIPKLSNLIKYMSENDTVRILMGNNSRAIGLQNQKLSHELGIETLIENIKYLKHNA